MHAPKRHFHAKLVAAAVFFLLMGGYFWSASANSHTALDAVWLFSLGLLSSGLGATGLFSAYSFRYEPDLKAAQQGTNGAVLIEEHGLRRQRRYLFRSASIVDHPVMPASHIAEVQINGTPHAVLHGREIIFLGHSQREVLHEFALRNGIPVRERPDIWDMIASVYVDTATTPEEHESLFLRLEQQGVSREDVLQARRKIRFKLMLSTYYSMEWVGYDHADVLRLASPIWGRRKFYWYTMELALRNFPASIPRPTQA